MRKKRIFIEANREGYSPEQCERHTMTAGELRAYLEDYDDDTEIYISNDHGYTYGSIHYDDISERYEDEEEEE